MAIYKDVASLEVVGYTVPKNGTFSDGVQFILEKLDAIPEADVEPVQPGYWTPESLKVEDEFVEVEFGDLTYNFTNKICNSMKHCSECPFLHFLDNIGCNTCLRDVKDGDRLHDIVKIPQKYFVKGE